MRAFLKGVLFIAILDPIAAGAAKPDPADVATVRTAIAWLHSLHSFRDSTESDPTAKSAPSTWTIVVTRLTTKDDLAVEVSSIDATPKVTLFARHWSDADTVLLRALEKHFGGSAGDPITPTMALQQESDRDADGIDHYLDAGKTEFTWLKDTPGLELCPWKNGCYIAEITPTPP